MTSNSRPVEFALSRKALFYPVRWNMLLLFLCFWGFPAWSNEFSLECREFLERDVPPCPVERPPGKWSTDSFEDVFAKHVIWANDARRENMWDLAPQFRVCLDYADLEGATLDGRDFECMGLSNAFLNSATLTSANLQCVDFRNADLDFADLRDADLRGADLTEAKLLGTKMAGADLTCTNLGSALLQGVEDLHAVKFRAGGQGTLIQLRSRLRSEGLREHERKVTFAIENNVARNMLTSGTLVERLDGLFRIVVFGGSVGWGLYPSRALILMLLLGLTLSCVYTCAITGMWNSRANGIFKVWPEGRLESHRSATQVATEVRVERLSVGIPRAIGWGLYFSLLSAFSIGWRDLNVGTWLSRIQRTEFALRGLGWIRTLAGVQSLLSVFLLAIWALSYFGRPFG